jgi:thioredoxin 1
MKVLKFQASWCGPCKGLSMVIKGAEDKITIPIEEVDIDNNVFMATNFNIRSVPTLVMVDKEEKEIKRITGMLQEKELLEWLGA